MISRLPCIVNGLLGISLVGIKGLFVTMVGVGGGKFVIGCGGGVVCGIVVGGARCGIDGMGCVSSVINIWGGGGGFILLLRGLSTGGIYRIISLPRV